MKISVLNDGYVEAIEYWGNDSSIIEAARMSTSSAFKGWGTPDKPGDEKLLKHLYMHKHTSPFEMAGMIVEVQAPLMVFREWMRHRTQSYNEHSARYSPMPNISYMPTVERCMLQEDDKNKQAGSMSGAPELTELAALDWLDELSDLYNHAESVYQSGLKRGIPKELARLCIPVARYSKMRASANLLNWLRFLGLRMAKDAQWEIRQFANAVGTLLGQRFPKTWELFQLAKL